MVNGEMKEKNGEDSYAFSVNDRYGMVSVFDGCGGIGSRKYAEFDYKTGAYISSRVSGEVFDRWFNEFSLKGNSTLSKATLPKICEEIRVSVTEKLKDVESNTESTMIKGALTKSFPSTASIALFSRKDKDSVAIGYIWAGDSRGYVLTANGMNQITKDDIEVECDAMENLTNDSKLTNMLCASGDFRLNSKFVTLSGPGIIITATDGCFGYFSTPMEVEYMIIESLMNSKSVNEWKENIHSYIKRFTGDDYTMGIAVLGYKNFKGIKDSYIKRYNYLTEKYMSKLPKASDEEKLKLWNEYKASYDRSV